MKKGSECVFSFYVFSVDMSKIKSDKNQFSDFSIKVILRFFLYEI